MTTGTVHIVDHDLGSTGNSNTVILVVHNDILQSNIVTGRYIETIRVVRSWVITTGGVGLVAIRVVQGKARNGEMLSSANVEAVNGPVLDVEVGDLGVIELLQYDEVIGPGKIVN
jgi:hypothetical protein